MPHALPPKPLIALLVALAGPACAPAAAHADPEVSAGAICDAVAPVVAATGQDDDGDKPDPVQSLAKAQQIQGILNRIQRNGGLSGGDINAIVRAAQHGDIGAMAGGGVDLANVLKPKIAGEGQDDDSSAAQGAPPVDPKTLDTARQTVRQDCERAKAEAGQNGDQDPADGEN